MRMHTFTYYDETYDVSAQAGRVGQVYVFRLLTVCMLLEMAMLRFSVAILLLSVAASISRTVAAGAACDAGASRTDCGYVGIKETGCEEKGCCWSPAENQPWCFYKNGTGPTPNGTCENNAPRSDCGYVGIDQSQCEAKGCCWNPKQGDAWCFYRASDAYGRYIVSNVTQTTLGVRLMLKYNGTNDSTPFGADVSVVQVEVEQQTNERLHVKITDPSQKRWEIPTNISPAPSPPPSPPSSPLYDYVLPKVGEPFNLTVIRRSDKSVIFSTGQVGVLRFVDQYLSIGTSLPDNYSIYGLGEHVLESFKLSSPQTLTLFNSDIGTPIHPNLYGSHPFYLELRSSGLSHGVFLRNSNGMDIVLSNNSLIYRTIGGVLDFYFFLGPQPEGVIQQYQEVIGRPHMPPYWALGFHNCRYGYPNVQTLEAVVANYSSAKIPLETMWTDIDYMDQYKDFTLDPVNYPKDEMNKFVDNLHSNGQHYVVIVDPGIKNENGYPSYDQGLKENSFIKDKNGDVFIGKVWPGTTAFTDFMNYDTHQYWQDQIATFLQLLPVDGLWIDMNEISNFCNGACSTDDHSETRVKVADHSETRVKVADHSETRVKYAHGGWYGTRTRLKRTGNRGIGFNPTNPPYAINNFDNKSPLNSKTLDMDALHMNGTVPEYDAHNLYGLSEAIATSNALENLKKKRSFVISRSTFPGSGMHTGHWTGDNTATFDDLLHSVIGMLNFQLFGVPLIGSDICGFHGATTVELCSRWIELGAFYPFSRDHNANDAPPQELYRWPEVAAVSRKVLAIRYSILPYYYTLFYKAHSPVSTATMETTATAPAATVTRPLFFEFPTDVTTFDIHTQFLIGSSIMISPIVTSGATRRDVYFPVGRWFDWYNQSVATEKGGITLNIPTPIDHIQIHVRGGYIVPMQEPGITTAASRKNPFSLLVALDSSGSAAGEMYLDDGESLDMSNYTFVDFSCSKNSLSSTVSGSGYGKYAPPLSAVGVLGLEGEVSKATLNGQPVPNVSYNGTTHSVLLSGFQTSLASEFTLSWE